MDRITSLQIHFTQVAERMVDLPVYNPALAIDTVGFQICGAREIGVLITPWCMNLIWLPTESDEEFHWGEASSGTKKMSALPSGCYEFIFGWAESVGGYWSCSIFSPMFEFTEQDVAIATAVEVMKALVDDDNEAPTDLQNAQRQMKQSLQSQSDLQAKPDQPEQNKQLSRRGFMTAGFSADSKVVAEAPQGSGSQ